MRKWPVVIRWVIGVATTTASMALAQSTSDPSQVDPQDIGLREGMIQMPSGLSRSGDDRTLGPAIAISGPIDPKIYRVGPGDLLQLQVWGRTSRNWFLQVGPEGYLLIPGSGTTMVSGRTLDDVRAEAIRKLKLQFRGVGMDMRLARPRTFNVYLTGQVRVAGPALASGANRIGDVVTAASLLPDGSVRRIEVRHTDGSIEYADLDLFLRTGNSSLNPWLRDGDVINVPVATDFIWAQGAVARPGRFELGPRDSLITLFRLAGDPVPSADAERALLIRWKHPFEAESLWIRLPDVYERKTNPVLREGDRLYVYFIPQYHVQHEVAIWGEVARPGTYPIFEGRHRLSDLLEAAGGFLDNADLSAIRVNRRNAATGEKDQELERMLRLSRDQLTASEYEALRTKLAGQREDYRVDWSRMTQHPELDLLLRGGDLVRVERLVSSVRIDGEVRRPGILSFRPGQNIGDYVDQAGGFTDRAWRGRVRVTRAVTGQTLLARNVQALDPGDFVWVPEKPDRTVWDHTRDILTAIAQIATVVIAVRSVN